MGIAPLQPGEPQLNQALGMNEKTSVAIRHVHFEDLGTFEAVLKTAGYAIRYLDAGFDDLEAFDPLGIDLLILLGGPIGAYETETYPFLAEELTLIRPRLAAQRPTLGICLGAQMMAAAMGAQVKPLAIKEIGFSPLTLTGQGKQSPLRHFDGVPVLHWHGDMFDNPPRATLLASTERCPHQAFSCGPNILGLQFHPEARLQAGFERWLIGHAFELAAAGIDPRDLRREAKQFASALRSAGTEMFAAWLNGLEP
jgi:GMP synthase (glutamine-hydrolysing)